MELPGPGDTFQGKYELHEVLGRGGFAAVFRATDVEVRRDVAVKILAPRDGEYPPGIVARFMVEARVLATLQDPHTIRLFDFGESETGLLYMVFQFVSGNDLSEVLRKRGRLEPGVVIHVLTQLLLALSEAHAAGVLHRDIKPANVLIHGYMGDEFSVKLLDFGIAKIEPAVPGGAGLTKAGTMLGTPRYMSPEQVFGEPLGPETDIYSLGLVAFEMLMGRPAVDGSTEDMLRAQVAEEPFELPNDIGWRTLRQVVLRMLSRDPRDRFSRATDVVAALEFARQHRDDEVVRRPSEPTRRDPTGSADTYRSPTNSSEVRQRRRDRGRLVLFIAIVLCVCVGAVAYHLSQAGRAPTAHRRGPLPNALITPQPASPEPEPVAASNEQDVGHTAVDAGRDGGKADPWPVDARPMPDGCGTPFQRKPETWFEINEDGFTRPMQAVIPPSYDPNKRFAVILTLQPRHIDEGQFAGRTGLVAVVGANKKGKQRPSDVILLAVSAENRLTPWTDVSDLPILEGAVREAARHLCIDHSRIYGVGHADGGWMLKELACQMQFSAIVLSGTGERHDKPSCVPSPPVPTLYVLGKQNHFVPRDGGQGCAGGDFLSFDEHDELWKSRNGCTGDPTRFWSAPDVGQCNVWSCTEATYGSCLVEGGHRLSDTRWNILDPPGCSATPLTMMIGPTAWAFFQKHGRALPMPEFVKVGATP